MLPVFQYENFVKRVKQKKREKGVSVFGILICDYRQQLCREYILNYLNRFHKLAGKNIDFYLPGYVQDYPIYEEENRIQIGNENYYFEFHNQAQPHNRLLQKAELQYLHPFSHLLNN